MVNHESSIVLISIIWNLWIQNKVRELFTGKKKVEEWTLLPLQKTSWTPRQNGLTLDDRMYIDKNFVAIKFRCHEISFPFRFQYTKILIVNLVSRTNFLIESDALENQIK